MTCTSYTTIAPVATAQIAAVVVITAPIITGWVDKNSVMRLSSDGVQKENAATVSSSKGAANTEVGYGWRDDKEADVKTAADIWKFTC